MISLLSNSYLEAPWCIRETEWLGEASHLARDPIERRLIPLELNQTDPTLLQSFPHFQKLLRGRLDAGILESVAADIAKHLSAARRLHGSVFLGQAHRTAESAHRFLRDELRGFRCGPDAAIFGETTAVQQALADAKISVHFLGDREMQIPQSLETILLSLEYCRGKTVGYLPPGSSLTADETEFVQQIRNHERWTMPECTPTELVEILTRELEIFRLPEPAIPLAVACGKSDLEIVRALAREIHEKAKGAFVVATPDFLANAETLTIVEWKKLLLRNPSALVYWGQGEKEYLDKNVSRFLKAAKFGRAWYVSGTLPEAKRNFQPDPDTDKIYDESQPFVFEKLEPFLRRVMENARK